jgi:hypothetical protein
MRRKKAVQTQTDDFDHSSLVHCPNAVFGEDGHFCGGTWKRCTEYLFVRGEDPFFRCLQLVGAPRFDAYHGCCEMDCAYGINEEGGHGLRDFDCLFSCLTICLDSDTAQRAILYCFRPFATPAELFQWVKDM